MIWWVMEEESGEKDGFWNMKPRSPMEYRPSSDGFKKR
jgi:hypothetical protein